jgi:hypothetical protein
MYRDKLKRASERLLRPYRLDWGALKQQELQFRCVPETPLSIQPFANDSDMRRHWLRYADRQCVLADWTWMHRIRTVDRPRPTPEWAASDAKVRAFFLWLYPKLHTDQSHRRRAGRDIRVFFASFRRLFPFPGIDEELNLAPGRAEYHSKKLRRLGDRFFSFAPRECPPRIARGKKIGTRMPIEFRLKMSRIRKAYWRKRACPENE